MGRISIFLAIVVSASTAAAYTIGEPALRGGFEGAWIKHFQPPDVTPLREELYHGTNVVTGPVTSVAPGYIATANIDVANYDIGTSLANSNAFPSGYAFVSIRDAFYIDTPDGSRSHLRFDLDLLVDRISVGPQAGGIMRVALWTHQSGVNTQTDRLIVDSWEPFTPSGTSLSNQLYEIALHTGSTDGLLDEHWAHMELEVQLLGSGDVLIDALNTLSLDELILLDPVGETFVGATITSTAAPDNPQVNFEQVPEPVTLLMALLFAAAWNRRVRV